MTIRCPVCAADGNNVSTCRRCKADLTLIFEVLRRAASLRAAARQFVQAGDFASAREAAQQAIQLHRCPESAQTLAGVALCYRDFPAALAWTLACRTGN